MKKILVSVLFVLGMACFVCPSAQTPKPKPSVQTDVEAIDNLSQDAVPLFAYTFISPWSAVYGSDSPEFVLYEDGRTIYTKCLQKNDCVYRFVKLSPMEIAKIVEALNTTAFYSFEDRYAPDTSKGTTSDLNTRLLVLRKADGTYKRVSTYGALFEGGDPTHAAVGVPDALRKLVEFVEAYDNPKSLGNSFKTAEVIIQTYFGDSRKSLKWPKKLPDLNGAKSIKHSKGGAYSIFVPASQYQTVRRLMYKQFKSNLPIIINDRKWKASERIPFPSEIIWLGNFRD